MSTKTKRDENGMTKEEIAAAVQEHGGDQSMTLMDSLRGGDVLDHLAAEGKMKVAKQSKTKAATTAKKSEAALVVTPKFSFQKPLPKVARFLSPEEEQEVIEGERRYRSEKAEALKAFATKIKDLVPDLVHSMRAFEAKPEEAQNLPGNKEKDEANRNGLADILNEEDPEAKTLAVKAISASLVLTCPKEYPQTKELLERLVNYDLLVKVDQLKKGEEGIYNAFGISYKLTPAFADDPEARDILRDARNLVRVVKEDGWAQKQAEAQTFEAKNESPMTVENLLARAYDEPTEKKEGTIILDIPEEEGRDHEGNPFIHRSGRMLFGVRDNKLFAIDGLGGKQGVARKLADVGTVVYLNQLRGERIQFSDQMRMSDMARKNVSLLHKLVRSGIRAMREKTEKATTEAKVAEAKKAEELKFAEERIELIAMTPADDLVTPEEMLFEGKPGTMLMPTGVLPDPWIRTDKQAGKPDTITEYRHPENALFIKGEDGKIKVVCPDRLKTLYQGAQEAAFPSDRFFGLVYPAGNMLRTLWGVTKGQKDEADRKAKEEAKAASATPTETGTEAQ